MLRIELFRRHYTNNTLDCVVYKVVDNQNHTTFLVVEFGENKIANFKNELISEMIETTSFQNWQELDTEISKIRKSGVIFI
jgi:hypothetical protein